MIQEFISLFREDFISQVLNFVYATSPVWVPILLFSVFIEIWLKYIQAKSIIKEGGILLEVKLPREVTKTPAAMEAIFTALFQAGKGDYVTTFVEGKHRPWFSLEIVSIDGDVRFFIWTKPKFRSIIETQFYAQYPGVEVFEVEDYAVNFHLDKDKTDLVGMAYKLGKDDIYPIKTYVDYGLDDPNQEEETKVDPLSSVLEFLGGLKPGEQVWYQILFQAHRKMTMKDDGIWGTKPDWTKGAQKVIDELIEKYTKGSAEEGGKRTATKVEKETIDSLQRSLAKLPFEVSIRSVYAFRKESFNPVTIGGMMGSFRQFSAPNLNEIRVGWGTGFDYKWQDFRGKRSTLRKHEILEAYKLRSYFMLPFKHALIDKPFILTTEELATLFHLPGKVVGTPTLTKVNSRKSEAPANLPI